MLKDAVILMVLILILNESLKFKEIYLQIIWFCGNVDLFCKSLNEYMTS